MIQPGHNFTHLVTFYTCHDCSAVVTCIKCDQISSFSYQQRLFLQVYGLWAHNPLWNKLQSSYKTCGIIPGICAEPLLREFFSMIHSSMKLHFAVTKVIYRSEISLQFLTCYDSYHVAGVRKLTAIRGIKTMKTKRCFLWICFFIFSNTEAGHVLVLDRFVWHMIMSKGLCRPPSSMAKEDVCVLISWRFKHIFHKKKSKGFEVTAD